MHPGPGTDIYYDTEFLEHGHGHPIHLVSIGMVRDDGATLYAVNADMDQHAVRTHPWLPRHVWPHLPLTGEGGLQSLDTGHPDVAPATTSPRRSTASDPRPRRPRARTTAPNTTPWPTPCACGPRHTGSANERNSGDDRLQDGSSQTVRVLSVVDATQEQPAALQVRPYEAADRP